MMKVNISNQTNFYITNEYMLENENFFALICKKIVCIVNKVAKVKYLYPRPAVKLINIIFEKYTNENFKN
jgi:hypothetical protein